MSTLPEFDERWRGAVIYEEHWHFYRRLFERYGIVLRPGEFSSLVAGLREGRALLVKARPNGTAIYQWRLRRRSFIFVLATKGMLITAWPPNRKLCELAKIAKEKAAAAAAIGPAGVNKGGGANAVSPQRAGGLDIARNG